MLQFLKTILRFFTVEPARKILAVLFAFGLWLFVVIEETYNYEKEIKVIFTGLPDNYIATNLIDKIKVTFSGKGKTLMGLWLSPPQGVCDLTDVVPGKNVISTKKFEVPVKDVLVNYEVKYINIEVDKKMSKIIKPFIPVKESLKNGYSISKIEVLDTLVATGPQKILQGLNMVKTESLDVKNLSATFEKKLKIESISEFVKFSEDNISVKVIVDTTGQRLFTGIAVNIEKNPKQVVKLLYPYIDTLVIRGAQNRVSSIAKSEISVRIRTTDLVSGEYYLTPEVTLPDFLVPLYYRPQRLKVVVY